MDQFRDAQWPPNSWKFRSGEGTNSRRRFRCRWTSREGIDSVRIAGRIDRIDTGVVAGQAVFNILDYKTGGPIKCTPETIQAGLTLQLPIYALAAMELLLIDRDAIPWHAGYWYVRDAGFQPKKSLRMYRNDDGRIELETLWEEIRDSLDDIVVGLVQAIRKGRFPVCSADDECTGRCQYNTICRVNQVRSLEKKWQPTDMQVTSPGMTEQQKKAVTTRGVSVALSAGAGCGKTFVLTKRFLAELEPDGRASRPRLGQLVAITFTERAAREMRDRIRKACHDRLMECPEDQARLLAFADSRSGRSPHQHHSLVLWIVATVPRRGSGRRSAVSRP